MNRPRMLPAAALIILVCVALGWSLANGRPTPILEPPGETPQAHGLEAPNPPEDDTDYLQGLLDALQPGDTLTLTPGRTYRQARSLVVRVPDVHITGPATIEATNEADSAIILDADGVTLSHVSLTITATTRRWDADQQMRVLVGNKSRISVSDVTIHGSAAAGIYVRGSEGFQIRSVAISHTRADGIHITGGAHDGVVTNVTVTDPGDDGVAVVSYFNGGEDIPCHDILIDSPRLYSQTWGRGFSVVGGRSIHWRNVFARGSSGAAIYVAAESSYDTYGNTDITFDGGTLLDSNSNPAIKQAAVVVFNDQSEHANSGIAVRNLRIEGVPNSPAVSLISGRGAHQDRISLTGLDITGASHGVLHADIQPEAYNSTAWTLDGQPLPDHRGW